MADETKPLIPPKTAKTRVRNGSVEVKGNKSKPRSPFAPKGGRAFASAGRYTSMKEGGILDDVEYRNKLRQIKDAARGNMDKVAGLFDDGNLGSANIADSNNIGYYSYEFPVDALELPASRAEELRFYRLAYDRDPIVGRAIDMHTEIPMSKMMLEKPKSSDDDFSDFVFDFYQGMVNDTKMFQVLIGAVREYWMIGETFLFVEDSNEIEPCQEAKKILEKNQKGEGVEPLKENEGASLDDNSFKLLDWLNPVKQSSLLKRSASLLKDLKTAGIDFDPNEDPTLVARKIAFQTAKVNKKIAKIAKVVSGKPGIYPDIYPLQITAAPPEELPAADDPAGAAPADEAGAPDEAGADADIDITPGGEGAPLGPEGLDDIAGAGDLGGAPPTGGGGGMGGGGGAMTAPDGTEQSVQEALAMGASAKAQRELLEMKHLLKLLNKKKELLEELQEIREKKRQQLELFSHIANMDYAGFDRIQVLPPEQIELANQGMISDDPVIYFKPPENQKQVYMEDPNVPADVKDAMAQDGRVMMNQNPFEGSYVIHMARKKSNYELHGRSILQRCIRTLIYREKLRQVQTTLASRNMTPKRLIVAPEIPPSEVMALRAHIDEAVADPDYTVVVNYECQWNEIGSEGRLLSLDGEWQHTNSDIAIGLGFSPEILIGEGLYSGNRIQLEILNTTYLQFRDVVSNIIEEQIFKPIAMKKGFYEIDKYGRPRWIYPKVSFSRMALRDSGDLYDMMLNLYTKGSLPVSVILEFLNIDPETVKRQLEDDLYTVNDSKFNNLLDNVYGNMGEQLITRTDIVKRVAKGLQLDEVEVEDEGMEGSGEGV
jgi:hypothetical protein